LRGPSTPGYVGAPCGRGLLHCFPTGLVPVSYWQHIGGAPWPTARSQHRRMGAGHRHPGSLPEARRGGPMRRLRAWLLRLADPFLRARRERELREEIESHLQCHVEDNLRSGMTPEEARRAALLKLGAVEALKEGYREQRGIPLLAQLAQDLRYAGRTLRRSPAVTAIALLTVSLGIAGPTVMFSMMKAWVLDPLPFPASDGLIDVRGLDTRTGDVHGVSPADFLDWQRAATSFEELSAYRQEDLRLTGDERAQRVRGARVTPGFFGLLGARAAAGRLLGPADGAA